MSYLSLFGKKPIVAFSLIHSAALATLLSYVGIITPILGLVAGLFGVVYGYYHMRCAYKEWQRVNKPPKIKPRERL